MTRISENLHQPDEIVTSVLQFFVYTALVFGCLALARRRSAKRGR